MMFNLRTLSGDIVFKDEVKIARNPRFTPDGEYVAFWKLADNTVRCYDVTEQTEAGHFDTTKLRKTNIGVEGRVQNDQNCFAIFDTYGTGDEELLGYISPQGELIEEMETVVKSDTIDADEPTDSDILDEVMSEFDQL